MIKLKPVSVILASTIIAGFVFSHCAGATSKTEDVEVVVAHYEEDISWIENEKTRDDSDANVRFIIYSKNQNNPPEEALPIPNVGRESQTFLHHIVTNYNSLADWTVFTQASAPGFGFRPNDQESGHMCSGVTWDDYFQSNEDGWYEVQTVATRYPEMWHSDRFDMMFQIPTSKGNVCPTDIDNGWGNWWIEAEHPLIKKQKTETDFVPPVEFYNRFVVADASSKTYDHFTLNYANGGRFAVSRDRILSRPVSYYEDLLRELSKKINPIEGYYMETMWFDVFHPEQLQAEYGPVCDVPPFEEGGATNHAIMYDDALKKYQDTLIAIYGSKASIPRGLQKSSSYFGGRNPDVPNEQPTPSSPPSPAPSPAPSNFPSFSPTKPLTCENGSPLLAGTGYCSVLLMGDNKEVYLRGDKEDRKPTGLYGNMCVAGESKLQFYGNQVITGFAKLEPYVETPKEGLLDYVWGDVKRTANLHEEVEAARNVAAALTNLTCDVTLTELPTLLNISEYKNTSEAGQVVVCVSNRLKIEKNVSIFGLPGDSVIFNIFDKFELKNAKVKTTGSLKPRDVIWHFIDDGEVKLEGGVGGYPNCCSAEIDGSIVALYRQIRLHPALVHGQVISEKDIKIEGGSLVNCHSVPYFYEWPPLASGAPSSMPSISLFPSSEPSSEPTRTPTVSPTASPSAHPTVTFKPSSAPTSTPTTAPTISPTEYVPKVVVISREE